MKKRIFIILLILTSLSRFASAQEKSSTIDFKFGMGFNWMQTVKMSRFENELTKKWNRFFSSSLSLNFATGGDSWTQLLTVLNGDINAFLSPFGNQRKFNFRIGTGISFIHLREAVVYSKNEFLYPPDGSPTENVIVLINKGVGLNIIIDHEISVGKRCLIGGRFNVQPIGGKAQKLYPYSSFGFLIKFGIKL